MKDNENKTVFRKFKDETNSLPKTEFVALNPNSYSFKHLKNDDTIINTKNSKGFSKYVVKYQITQDPYMDTMKRNERLSRDVVSLRSKDHMIRTIKNTIIAVNSFYDKMQLINAIDGIHFGFKQCCSLYNLRIYFI